MSIDATERSDHYRLWHEGLAHIIELTGLEPDLARKLVGHLLRRADRDPARVLQAIRAAREHTPAEPIPWLVAAVEARR